MARTTKEAIAAMTEQVVADLATVRSALTTEQPGVTVTMEDVAMTSLETFVAIALRVFSETNPSKLREAMRVVEIQARMDGKRVYE